MTSKKRSHRCVLIPLAVALLGLSSIAFAAAPEPIRSVTLGTNNEFRLNGHPFLPIFGWLQKPANLPKLADVGMNAIAGYHRSADGRGNLETADAYAKAASDAGLYFLCAYDRRFPEEMERVKALDNILGWMQEDEPDLVRETSDVTITAKSKLRINSKRPLNYMTDGNPKTSTVLSPVQDAEVAIRYSKPATVTRFSLGNGPNGTKIKEVSLVAGEKEILRVTLPEDAAMHSFPLPAPTTFQDLTLKVVSTYENTNFNWGTFTDVDGFDAAGVNVLASPVQKLPRQSPESVLSDYRKIKALDANRPVLLTFASFFFSDFHNSKWWSTEQAKALYPQFVGSADVYGIDIYPIYGWNQPAKISQVARSTEELRKLVGPHKPVYQWIETFEGNFGEKSKPVSGREIRNEVYQALASGCTAIGYFTHRVKPTFSEFGVPPENQAAIRVINAEITALAPALLGADASSQPTLEIAGGLSALCHAESDGKIVTLIALNMDGKDQGGAGTLKLPGLKDGTKITVYGENRSLTSGVGQWQDQFDPLAVHIYQFALP
jgi:hypothetical protein